MTATRGGASRPPRTRSPRETPALKSNPGGTHALQQPSPLRSALDMTDSLVRQALGDVIDVRERLAEVGNDVKHLSHDIKNLLQAMGNFVPRAEIMEMRNASIERSNALHARIDLIKKDIDASVERIEEAQTWLMHKIIGWSVASAGGGGAVAFGAMKLFGAH